jgi:hypothetical protein
MSGNAAGKLVCAMTTIQEPTPSARRTADRLVAAGGSLIVVGDKKGPARFELPATRFVPLAEQVTLPFRLAPLLPAGHYVRKNLAYLLAFAAGADRIFETDDDNAPLPAWEPRAATVGAVRVTRPGWCNVYRLFTDQIIWPRGLPLRHARDAASVDQPNLTRVESPIQQELANVAPDVDAAWRLTLANEPFAFDAARPSVNLAPGAWCPFNSQATWWFKPAFPLMYLPSTCTFRMTDIWRSLVAQRCLWELGHGLTFHAPVVEQERNVHDLTRDFEDEVPGYLKNEQIARTLDALTLRPGPDALADNLVRCYEALVAIGVLKPEEMQLVRAWTHDISQPPRIISR